MLSTFDKKNPFINAFASRQIRAVSLTSFFAFYLNQIHQKSNKSYFTTFTNPFLFSVSSMSVVSQLSRLRVEHQNGKVKHENWITENQAMAGTKEYDDYIEQFQKWEEGMLSGIETIQQMLTRRPVEQAPELPGQDLDGQLYAMLENISQPKFAAAFVKLCKEDPSIFGILTEVNLQFFGI